MELPLSHPCSPPLYCCNAFNPSLSCTRVEPSFWYVDGKLSMVNGCLFMSPQEKSQGVTVFVTVS